MEDRHLRKRGEGDGFIDSVFTAIMQISSTIIPKYIESGFGHHPKERLSEFPNIWHFLEKIGKTTKISPMSLSVSLSIPGVSLRMLSLPQLQGSRRQLVPFAPKRVWHPMKVVKMPVVEAHEALSVNFDLDNLTFPCTFFSSDSLLGVLVLIDA